MFTFGFLYVIIYLFIFISLMFLSFSKLPIQLLTQYSSTSYLVFLQKYTTLRPTFLSLLVSLTGLPPFGLFFVKFNVLVFILYQVHIAVITVVFMLFFLNMLYYTQLFNSKNTKVTFYATTQPNISKFWTQVVYKQSLLNSYTTYTTTLFIASGLLFIFFFIFFFSDFFLVISLFF